MNTSTADRERHLLDGAILEWDGERLTLTLSRAQIIWWCKFASREGEHGSPFTISFGPDGDVSIYILCCSMLSIVVVVVVVVVMVVVVEQWW